MRALTYRLSLGLAGLVWTVIAATFCGCNQTSGYVNNQAGRGYYMQGNYTAARHAFERAAADDPQNADYAFNVASSMNKQGDAIAAERMYQRALAIDPSHQPAYHGYAGMLDKQGRTAEAQQLLAAWNQAQPHDAESYIEMAYMQQQQGDVAGAEQSLQQALRISPKHPVALAQLGNVYEQSGRMPEAAGMYQRSLRINPYQPKVKSHLAQLSQPQPNGTIQTANVMPQGEPMMSASAIPTTAYMSPGPYGGSDPGQPMVLQSTPATTLQPVPESGPQPVMTGVPLPTGVVISSEPVPLYPPGSLSSAPVEVGTPAPAINADPAHVPLVGMAPTVEAF